MQPSKYSDQFLAELMWSFHLNKMKRRQADFKSQYTQIIIINTYKSSTNVQTAAQQRSNQLTQRCQIYLIRDQSEFKPF